MAECHNVKRADRESHIQKRDSDTVTITEAEDTSTLPHNDDWKALLGDFERTNTLRSGDQRSSELGSDDAVPVNNFDEEVSGTSEEHYHCDHPGCGLTFSTRSLLL